MARRLGVIDVPMRCYSGGVLDVFIEPNLSKAPYFCCAHCKRTFEQDPHRYAHVA